MITGSRSASRLHSFYNIHRHLLSLHYLYAKLLPPPLYRFRCHPRTTLDCASIGDINDKVGRSRKNLRGRSGNDESVKMLGTLKGAEVSVLPLVVCVILSHRLWSDEVSTDFNTWRWMARKDAEDRYKEPARRWQGKGEIRHWWEKVRRKGMKRNGTEKMQGEKSHSSKTHLCKALRSAISVPFPWYLSWHKKEPLTQFLRLIAFYFRCRKRQCAVPFPVP